MVESRDMLETVGKGLAVLLALLVVLALVIGGAFTAGIIEVNQPTVESVTTQWGAVTEESTAIETEVVVDNPNVVAIPGVLDLSYSAALNDVVLAEGTRESMGLSKGENTIEMSSEMRNDAIAEWWVTHVNGDERSTLEMTAQVDGPMGISETIPVSESTIETDLLGNLASDGQRTISMGDDEFLVLEEQTASWGEATSERTPLTFTATVENVHDYAVSLDGLGYAVQMNDVVVGNGTQSSGVTVDPGETETITVTAALSTPKMADWWATHVRNDESTELSVSMYGFVEENGERTRLPMEFFEKDLLFETAMLDGGATSTEPIPKPDESGEDQFGAPTVASSDRRWGDVTDETTPVETSITIDNPNDDAFSSLLSVDVDQSATINGVTVSDGSTRIDAIEPGTNDVQYVAQLDNSKVPEWWAKHVNNGEQSTISMAATGVADVRFTKFDVPIDEQTTDMATDMISELDSDEREVYTIEGREVAVVTQTRANWGEATPETTPITVRVTVENTAMVPVTFDDLDYRVAFNDVVVGNETAPEEYTIDPGETAVMEFSLDLDSQRMDEWWVSHIENGEETVVETSATINVSARGTTETVEIVSMDTSKSFTTDLLAE